MTTLKIIVASTRPGSSGPAVGGWIAETARRTGEFDRVEVLDLAEINLPFLDEPHHPKLGRYTKPHTLAWAREIDTADALVIITPEYNSGFPAPLKNAIDFLHAEWADKAVGFVSYGGIAAGTRAVQQLKQVVTTLRMVPVFDAVYIPMAASQLQEDGSPRPDDERDGAAKVMLDELRRLTLLLSGSSTVATAG